jgi:hypothetical protein
VNSLQTIGGGVTIHPFVLLGYIWSVIALLIVLRTKADFNSFIEGLNRLEEQPTAILVLLIGCAMLCVSKKFNLDSTVAGTIIGVGSNMLQNKFKSEVKDQSTKPPLSPQPEVIKETPTNEVH